MSDGLGKAIWPPQVLLRSSESEVDCDKNLFYGFHHTERVMPQYWMISARDSGGTGINRNKNGVTFWVSDSPNDAGQLRDINNWRRVPFVQFRKALITACAQFPDLPPEQQEEEKHLALCIHGYNNGFADSIDLYTRVCKGLFAGADTGCAAAFGSRWE